MKTLQHPIIIIVCVAVILFYACVGLLILVNPPEPQPTEIQQTCEPYADHPFTVIPAKCMQYFIDPD